MRLMMRSVAVLGLAMLVLMIGAMQFDPILEPTQVSAPPAIEAQVLGRHG